jgi:hypothetical protein
MINFLLGIVFCLLVISFFAVSKKRGWKRLAVFYVDYGGSYTDIFYPKQDIDLVDSFDDYDEEED